MWAIVPYKGIPSGKSRLAEHMDSEQRIALVEAMLRDVLDALAGAQSLSGVILSSPAAESNELADQLNIRFYRDRARSLAGAVTEASEFAMSEVNAQSTFIVPADVPLVRSGDIDLAASQHHQVTIIPDSEDIGTNGLICSPPNAIEYVFDGKSFRPHVEAARRVGVSPQVVRLAAFGHDVDDLGDLELVASNAPRSHTARAVRRLGILPRSELSAAS